MLKHYNIAAVMTGSPQENLQFLADVIITANHSFIRFHGRNTKGHYWYNYLYYEQELKPWIEKLNQIRKQTKILRIYFNNHYGGKAVINAMQFKEMNGRKNIRTCTSVHSLKLEHHKHLTGPQLIRGP